MKYNYTALLLFLSIALWGQSQQLDPCGSTQGRSPWLKEYQKNPALYEKGNDEVIYVPITVHNLGSTSGLAYFRMLKLMDALCVLNQDFEGTDIQFYLAGDINHIADSDYNSHSEILEGAQMMFEHNVENTLNCYIVTDPAGNCGYNLPYAGLAVAKSCAAPNDHTWSHEVGHAFSLPHPFLGWEGGISYDGSIDHNYNNPAPREVYIDYTFFKDSLLTDTLIIDTVLVELTDRTNCYEAADGFCDTEADYLGYRWNCTSQNANSGENQTDPDGVKFKSDGTLIMSYADDACSYRFSPEQIAAMRANLYDEKPELLHNQTPMPFITDGTVEALEPLDAAIVPAEQIHLEWTPVEHATHYIVEVSRLNSFSIIEVDTVLTSNELWIDQLRVDKFFYWRVRPYNNYSFCAPTSTVFNFRTAEVTNTTTIENIENIQLYPSPLHTGTNIQLQLQATTSTALNLRVHTITGQTVYESNERIVQGENHFEVATTNWESGLYFVELATTEGSIVRKLVVQ